MPTAYLEWVGVTVADRRKHRDASNWARAVALVAFLLMLQGCADVFYNVPKFDNASVDELLAVIRNRDGTSRGRETRASAITKLNQLTVLNPDTTSREQESLESLVVSGLLELLDVDHPQDREGSLGQKLCSSLGLYDSQAARIVPKLIDIMDQVLRDEYLGLFCFGSLADLSSPAVPQGLSLFMRHAAFAESNPTGFGVTQNGIRFHPSDALQGIANIGPSAREAIPLLERIIAQRPIGIFQVEAAQAYWKVTGEPSKAIELAIAALNLGGQQIRDRQAKGAAMSVLFDLGATASAASQILHDLTLNENGYCSFSEKLGPATGCQVNAAVVLWRVDPSQGSIVTSMFEKPWLVAYVQNLFCRMDRSELAPLIPFFKKAYDGAGDTKRYGSDYSKRLRSEVAGVLQYATGERYPEVSPYSSCEWARHTALLF